MLTTAPRQSSTRLRLRAALTSDLPLTERRLDLAGISTPLLEGGDGPPLVVLHGPGEFAPRWRRVVAPLAATHRLVIPDLPGHGESDAGDVDLTEARVMQWLGAVIDSACFERPVLVGHLLGGAIAARFAAAHGERIDRLVLADSLGLAKFRPSLRFVFRLIRFMARPTEGSYHRFMAHCEHDRDRLADDMGESWDLVRDYSLELARDAGTKAAMRTLMTRVGMPPIPSDDLAGITVPTTLLWGRHNKAIRVSVAQEASDRYGWPLHVIEGTADDAPMEQPAAFVEALRKALGSAIAAEAQVAG